MGVGKGHRNPTEKEIQYPFTLINHKIPDVHYQFYSVKKCQKTWMTGKTVCLINDFFSWLKPFQVISIPTAKNEYISLS